MTSVSDSASLTAPERRLRVLLRFFAVLFGLGAITFFAQAGETLANLDRVGTALGLSPLPTRAEYAGADFWLVLAVANMATIAACCWLAAADVRGRRALVYPLVVSKLTSSAAGLALFLVPPHAFAYLSATLVDLPIALVTLAALHATTLPPGPRHRI